MAGVGNPVEEALARALGGIGGGWDVVARLARELDARRCARAQVIDLRLERQRGR